MLSSKRSLWPANLLYSPAKIVTTRSESGRMKSLWLPFPTPNRESKAYIVWHGPNDEKFIHWEYSDNTFWGIRRQNNSRSDSTPQFEPRHNMHCNAGGAGEWDVCATSYVNQIGLGAGPGLLISNPDLFGGVILVNTEWEITRQWRASLHRPRFGESLDVVGTPGADQIPDIAIGTANSFGPPMFGSVDIFLISYDKPKRTFTLDDVDLEGDLDR